jgi:magnesium-transporting ATPase (P-type)
MEGALLAFAGKVAAIRPARRLDAIPFDSRHRFMAVLTEGPAGGVTHVKGAPERVLRMCAAASTCSTGTTGPRRWRGGACGCWRWPSAPRRATGSTRALEGGLTFLGLVGLIDPPRPEAIAAVAECRAAGIRVKMITGDHAGTAAAIARRSGCENPDRVLTGADLDKLDDAQLALEVAASTSSPAPAPNTSCAS